MYASLFGRAYEDRVKSISTLAYLPLVRKDWHEYNDLPQVRTELLSKCYDMVLAPLKVCSARGLDVILKDGSGLCVFPRLPSVVGDDPEDRQLCRIMASGGSMQCCQCYVSKGQFLRARCTFVEPQPDWQPDILNHDQHSIGARGQGTKSKGEEAALLVGEALQCTRRTEFTQGRIRALLSHSSGLSVRNKGRLKKYYSTYKGSVGFTGFKGMQGVPLGASCIIVHCISALQYFPSTLE
jgi:hypothetical protein